MRAVSISYTGGGHVTHHMIVVCVCTSRLPRATVELRTSFCVARETHVDITIIQRSVLTM